VLSFDSGKSSFRLSGKSKTTRAREERKRGSGSPCWGDDCMWAKKQILLWLLRQMKQNSYLAIFKNIRETVPRPKFCLFVSYFIKKSHWMCLNRQANRNRSQTQYCHIRFSKLFYHQQNPGSFNDNWNYFNLEHFRTPSFSQLPCRRAMLTIAWLQRFSISNFCILNGNTRGHQHGTLGGTKLPALTTSVARGLVLKSAEHDQLLHIVEYH